MAVVAAPPAPVVAPAPVKATPKVAKAAPAAETPAKDGKSVRLQLASFPDESVAQVELKKLQAKYARALNGVTLHIVRADLAKGTYYRVQSGPLSDSKAHAICVAVADQNGACIVVKP